MSESKYGEPWDVSDHILLMSDHAIRACECVNACAGWDIEEVRAILELEHVKNIRDELKKSGDALDAELKGLGIE